MSKLEKPIRNHHTGKFIKAILMDIGMGRDESVEYIVFYCAGCYKSATFTRIKLCVEIYRTMNVCVEKVQLKLAIHDMVSDTPLVPLSRFHFLKVQSFFDLLSQH